MRELIEDKAATQSLATIGRHYHALAGGTKEGGGDTGVRGFRVTLGSGTMPGMSDESWNHRKDRCC